MAKGGGTMEIIMLVVLLGGAWLLWPHISGMLNGLGGDLAGAGAVKTDTSGGGKADADDGGGGAKAGGMGDEDDCTNVRDARAMAECIRNKTRRMISRTRRRAGGGLRQFNSGGSGSNVRISSSGGGNRSIVCVNGKCTSSYGESYFGIANVNPY